MGGASGRPDSGSSLGERAISQRSPGHPGLLAGDRPLVKGDAAARVDEGQQEFGMGGVPDAARREALGATGVQDAVVPPGGLGPRKEHQLVAGEFGERDLRYSGQRGSAGQDDAQIRDDLGPQMEFGGIHGLVDEAYVEPAGGE
jgi:hypothetical protein